MIARPGGFFFSDWPPHTRPWPLQLPLWVDWIMCFAHLQWAPGGFRFDVGRPFLVARYKAGKMPALHGIEG